MLQQVVDSAKPIILAHVAPFRLGEVEVHPSLRRLILDGRSETLEPRVMQVLVVLAQAGGAVVTRDELIERCWGGRIVGENAINRVISRIRHVASNLGTGSFELETITKVGYRLVVEQASNEMAGSALVEESDTPQEPRATIGRRRFVIGATAAALAAAGGAGALLWQGGAAGGTTLAAARALYQKGVEAQRQGVLEQNKQAVAFFRQAVTTDPGYADAWGALALGYRQRLVDAPAGEQEALAARSRSAAERALVLDPDNADAQVALILIRPNYRNWAVIEKKCLQALAGPLDHWLLHGALGLVLMDVGRWSDAIDRLRAQNARDPFLPHGHADLASAYMGAGRVQEAEDTLDRALALWPNHPNLWFNRFHWLTYGGRPAAAIAFAGDRETRPYGIPEPIFASYLATARALETGAAADVEAVFARRLDEVRRGAASPGVAAQLCAALGQTDTAFALLDAYYFGGGPLAPQRPAPGTFARRFTAFLFTPPVSLLHADPRFAALTKPIGLEDYWRSTGTAPDFRSPVVA